MTGENRRSRCVVFRVSEREYDCLKSACEAGGHGNLSDYARSELLGGSYRKNDGALWQTFLEIDQKITKLYQSMNLFLEELRGGNPQLTIPAGQESNEKK